MIELFKATRPDGTDFYTGTVDYAAALREGGVLRHPTSDQVRPDDPATHLSVSTDPASTLLGGSWPCRLFRVEAVGDVTGGLRICRNKRAVLAVTVVEELPAHRALGPNGEAVAGFISKIPEKISAAQDAAQDAAWDAAWAAAWVAAWDAAWDAARVAAWDAAEVAAWDAARAAAVALAVALAVKDLISPEDFDTLMRPWRILTESGA